MYFDKLCGIAERHLPKLIPVLNECRFFDFPYFSHEVLPKSVPNDVAIELRDSFFLPFQIVAVEDKDSVIVLWDHDADQVGMECRRNFIELTNILPHPEREMELSGQDKAALESIRAREPEGYLLTMGWITMHPQEGATEATLAINGQVEFAMVANKNDILMSPDRYAMTAAEEMQRTGRNVYADSVGNASQAIQELMLLNTPNRFVVERRPAKVADFAKVEKKGRVVRTDNRPTYLLMTSDEAREAMQLPKPEGGKRKAHERRRHKRLLSSPRYVNMQGQEIVIPASWIGPNAAKVGRREYVVRLDL